MDELIYDRTQSDVNYALSNPDSANFLKGAYNYIDLNRIEQWCGYVAQQLNLYDYTVSITVKTDWEMDDFPTKQQMKRIRDNVGKLKDAFYAFTSVPINLEKMTYTKANDIEKILYEINTLISNMVATFWHSDEIYSGEA